MSKDSNKLSQFWQELKRRNVIRVITVYAGAAFVIIELINNITEPLRLPEWTPTLVIVLLAIGFPVIIIISWIYDVHPEGGIVKTEPAEKAKTEQALKSSSGWKIATYVSVVIILGLIAYNIFGGKRGPGIDESLAKSIAVLPFINMSGEDEREFICDGLTEEIINDLFKVGSFDKVAPYSNVRIYKNSDKSLAEIAEELGVNYLLTSSYKRMGEEIEITPRLIEPESGKRIWSVDYELPYGEIMGIPGNIALQIADHLRAFMAEDIQQNISSQPTENLEAYELVQQIKSIFNANPFENYDTIINLAEQAIALDPNYADPYAWKGMMILVPGAYWGTKDMRTVAREAEDYLDKALRIDPNNFMANSGMAWIDYFVNWDYVKAAEFMEKFKDQMSFDINFNFAASLFLLSMDELKEALLWTERESHPVVPNYILIQILEGNTDYARDLVEKDMDTLRSLSDVANIMQVLTWLQDFDQLMSKFNDWIALGQDPGGWWPQAQADLAVASFKTGRTDLARTMVSKMIERSDTTSVGSPAYCIGWYYSWIGELDSAFYWLDKAVENRSPSVVMLKVDPAFNSLKDDPRYWDLYNRTGFKAYDEYMANRKE